MKTTRLSFSGLVEEKEAVSEFRQRLKKWRRVPARRERLGEMVRRATRFGREVVARRERVREASDVGRAGKREKARRLSVVVEAVSDRERGVMTSTLGAAFQFPKVWSVARRIGCCPPGKPNQTPEPTTPSVTPRADARVAPAAVVAHL